MYDLIHHKIIWPGSTITMAITKPIDEILFSGFFQVGAHGLSPPSSLWALASREIGLCS